MLKKSYLKRFKITRLGKILVRVAGQSHSFTKKRSNSLRRKKRLKEFKLLK